MKIRLFQVNSERDAVKADAHRLIFREYDKDHFSEDVYDLVYEGDVEASTLDDVFEIFNINHPVGYEGRSLSVSDIVEVVASETTNTGFYYCQHFGWLSIEFRGGK